MWLQLQQLGHPSSDDPILPAFATGLIDAGGGPLHFDLYHSHSLMVVGRKQFFLLPPKTLEGSRADPDGANVRWDVHPLNSNGGPALSDWLLAELAAGDALYVPPGWWHYVISQPHSIHTSMWSGEWPECESCREPP